MEKKVKIVHYINQFFGQIGGEEQAFIEPRISQGPVGPGLAFTTKLGESYEIVATVICGDNYIAENQEEAVKTIVEMVKEYELDVFVAGPAFNAGRYGPACGEVCKAISNAFNVPCVTGMYEENPGVEIYKKDCYIVKTKDSAASMRASVDAMTKLIHKLVALEEVSPEIDGYVPKGIKKNVFVEKNGAVRAVEMLLAKLRGEQFKTELLLAPYEMVDMAPPIVDLKNAKIALISDAGITDKENTNRLESARATKYLEINLESLSRLEAEKFASVHGGFDTAYANTNPDVLMPLEVIREFKENGKICDLHEILYSTTGNGTSLANSKKFGTEIAQKLLEANVQGAILTST